MGLEGHHQPLIPHFLGGWSTGRGARRGGGRSHRRPSTVILPLVLKAAASAGKGSQTGLTALPGRPARRRRRLPPGRCRHCARPQLEVYVGVYLAVDHDVKAGEPSDPGRLARGSRPGMVEAEPEQRAVQPVQSCSGAGVIALATTWPVACGTSSAKERKECWMSPDP